MYLLKLSLFKLLPKGDNLTTDLDFSIQTIRAIKIFTKFMFEQPLHKSTEIKH